MRPQASHLSHQTASRRAAPRRASRLRIMLLATSALASAALPTTLAHADDASWKNPSIDGDFNNRGNWSGGVVPDALAQFGSTDQDEITFNRQTNLATLTLLDNTRAYTFTNASTLTFTGAGIFFFRDGVAASITNLSSLNFNGSSTAGRASISNNVGA